MVVVVDVAKVFVVVVAVTEEVEQGEGIHAVVSMSDGSRNISNTCVTSSNSRTKTLGQLRPDVAPFS